MAAKSPTNSSAARWIFALPAIYYLLHILDELNGFSEWVSNRFTPKDELTFALFSIITYSLVLLISTKAVKTGSAAWKTLAFAAQVQFFCNGFFHIGASILMSEYVPGMFTASVGIIVSVWFFLALSRYKLITSYQSLVGASIGVLIALLAIGALYL